MKKLTSILLITMALAALPIRTIAAEKSAHNPQGDDKVEEGWKKHQEEHGKGKSQETPSKSTTTETTEHYGKRYLEEQVQGTKEPKVNRTY